MALPSVLMDLPTGYRAIVVNNGSSDGSASVAKKLGATVLVEHRRGVGAASTAGVLAATANIVCILDCDATVSSADLPSLVQPILDGQAQLVVGTRQYEQGAVGRLQRLTFMTMGLFVRRRYGVALSDLGSARAVRRDALGDDWRTLHWRNGWSVDLLHNVLLRSGTVKSVSLPYKRRLGKSKITGTPTGALLTIYDSLRVGYMRPRPPRPSGTVLARETAPLA